MNQKSKHSSAVRFIIILRLIRCTNDALFTYFAAFVEIYILEVFRDVEKRGQSNSLVFLCYSDCSRVLEGDFGTGKIS